MPEYRPYIYNPAFTARDGWDRYADEYAALLQPGTLYYLHKQVMYDYTDRQILPRFGNRPLKVLDVNCGCGNDFPYWLLCAEKVVGMDGSAGMLHKAYEIYEPEILKGKLQLFHGKLEDLNQNSLGGEKFDIVYSITGGFSYVDDYVFARNIETLSNYLTPGGVMITAHLTSFCLPETLIYLMNGKVKRALVRLKRQIALEESGATMYLRSAKQLRQLFLKTFSSVDIRPLIALAPPSQTKLTIQPATFRFLRRVENVCTQQNLFSCWADQLIVTCWKH